MKPKFEEILCDALVGCGIVYDKLNDNEQLYLSAKDVIECYEADERRYLLAKKVVDNYESNKPFEPTSKLSESYIEAEAKRFTENRLNNAT